MSEIANKFKVEGWEKLLAAQKELPTHLQNESEGHNNTYLSLAALIRQVRPTLNKHGLVLTQGPKCIEGKAWMVTRITLSKTGMTVAESEWPLDGSGAKGMSAAQAVGAAATYSKRYALTSLLGLGTSDDPDPDAQAQQGPSGSGSPQNKPSAPANGRKVNGRALKPQIEAFQALVERVAATHKEQAKAICQKHGIGKDATQWLATAVVAATKELEALDQTQTQSTT